jgi:hypothetical protein
MRRYVELHRCFPDQIQPEAYMPFLAWWEICEAVITLGLGGAPENPWDHTARDKPRSPK